MILCPFPLTKTEEPTDYLILFHHFSGPWSETASWVVTILHIGITDIVSILETQSPYSIFISFQDVPLVLKTTFQKQNETLKHCMKCTQQLYHSLHFQKCWMPKVNAQHTVPTPSYSTRVYRLGWTILCVLSMYFISQLSAPVIEGKSFLFFFLISSYFVLHIPDASILPSCLGSEHKARNIVGPQKILGEFDWVQSDWNTFFLLGQDQDEIAFSADRTHWLKSIPSFIFNTVDSSLFFVLFIILVLYSYHSSYIVR